jgi:hypothetical protein
MKRPPRLEEDEMIIKAHFRHQPAVDLAKHGRRGSAEEIDHRNMKNDALALDPRVEGHLFGRTEFRQVIDQPIRR